jgi:predicted HTH transcriptional regulator
MNPIPSDAELLARMKNFEDNFVERKTVADDRDWLKTIVAFANSTPPGWNSVLFIGVKNSGEIETPQVNLDSLQIKLNATLLKTYPPIPCFKHVVEQNRRQALAVIVPYSENKPHFAGPSYVRKGSETVIASEDQFAELIASRNSLVAEILAHKDEFVHVVNSKRGNSAFDSYWPGTPKIHDCNQHFITIESGMEPRNRITFPISDIVIGREPQSNRFQVTIYR